MFNSPIARIGIAALLLVVGLALWRGKRAERLGALIYTVDFVGSNLLQDRHNLVEAQYRILALDMLAFAALLALALWSRRTWVLWAAAFQLVTVLTHVAVAVDRRLMVRAYITALYLWGFLQLVPLALGAMNAPRPREAAQV